MVSFLILRPFGPIRQKCSAQAIEKGNAEGARIYAQNAIREKNSGLNYLRMSARIDAVAQRLDTVVKNQAMQKSIVKVNKGLSSALKSMNVEKISKEMDAFERQFEDIDVRAKCDLGVLRCWGAFHVTRVHLTRSWVVSFPISRPIRCSAQVHGGRDGEYHCLGYSRGSSGCLDFSGGR